MEQNVSPAQQFLERHGIVKKPTGSPDRDRMLACFMCQMLRNEDKLGGKPEFNGPQAIRCMGVDKNLVSRTLAPLEDSGVILSKDGKPRRYQPAKTEEGYGFIESLQPPETCMETQQPPIPPDPLSASPEVAKGN